MNKTEITKFIIDFMILMLIALPPFLYFFRYICNRTKNILIRTVVFIIYWGSTLLISNLVPAVVVVFLIWRSKISYRSSEGEYVKFYLGGNDDKWDFSFRSFITVAVWGIVIKTAVTYANEIVVLMLQYFKVPMESQEVINEFINAGMWGSIVYFIVIVFCAPIVEEFVFRFWIYDRLLKKRVGAWISAVLTSMLFMIAHFNIQGAFAFFLIGIVNCYLYDKKGYWAAVANHFMFNFSTVIVLIAVKAFNIPLS
jgi:membrane protease YdiL (CAAX protease family)